MEQLLNYIIEALVYMPFAVGIFLTNLQGRFAQSSSGSSFGLPIQQRLQAFGRGRRLLTRGTESAFDLLDPERVRRQPVELSDAAERQIDPETGLLGDQGALIREIFDQGFARNSADLARRGFVTPRDRLAVASATTQRLAPTLLPMTQATQQFLRNLDEESRQRRAALLQQQGAPFAGFVGGGTSGSKSIDVSGKVGFA